jgi:hypothetical protein
VGFFQAAQKVPVCFTKNWFTGKITAGIPADYKKNLTPA